MDFLTTQAIKEFESIYDLDKFFGYDKFREHLEIVPPQATFNLILFDCEGATQNLVNMASLLKTKFPSSTVNLVALDNHLNPNLDINRRILLNLQRKGVQTFLNADFQLDTENLLFSVFDKENGECQISGDDLDFMFFSSFRKWPSFLAKGNIFEEEICKQQLMHKNFSNIFSAGSLQNPHSSLHEKFNQSRVAMDNIERKVPIFPFSAMPPNLTFNNFR